MQPLDYCRQAEADRQIFAPVSMLFPTEKRDMLMVLDVFCGELRRLVREHSDVSVAQAALNWRRADLVKAFAGENAEHPPHQALAEMAPKYGLPYREFADILDGTETDLKQMRYTDGDWLMQYCSRVYGAAWRLAARIAGADDENSLHTAEQYGTAARLTEILRDVGKDARAGRIYLPMNEMQQFGVPAADILRGNATPQFAALMAGRITQVQNLFYRAAAMPSADKAVRRPLDILAALFYALLQEIAHDGAQNVLKYTLAIPKPRRTRIIWKTRLFGFKPRAAEMFSNNQKNSK
ncbi:MAG: squalene/phytoene synthase family protein [Neisseria sp.]|nr:squalene/phytoene synthase family protein [Neisseria sp.]